MVESCAAHGVEQAGAAAVIGFMWNCPWRVEWKTPHEYWDRTQFGPFYYLHHKPAGYWEEYEREQARSRAEDGE